MTTTKSLSKAISLFIKTVMFIASVYYIFLKIRNINATVGFDYIIHALGSNYFIAAIILMPVNWGIEAIKWKFLIKKLEIINFKTAFQSVLSGVSISIFTPNRIGEFAGRVFYLKTEEKIKATVISFIGSAVQLSVTTIAGSIAIICYLLKKERAFQLSDFIDITTLMVFVIGLILLVIILFMLLKRRNLKEKLQTYSKYELLKVFLYSAMRYLVFSTQFYLLLVVFNIHIEITTTFTLIAITFLISTIIPTFALTEIAVRSAAAVFIFSAYTSDVNAVISASVALWIINLALPALLGSAYIWKLNFFNN